MPRKVVRAATKHRRAKKVGIAALGGYDAQSLSQGQMCAICGYARKPGGRRLAIDHSHTGMLDVRGLLCGRCNRGLRWFSDSPDALMTASFYLSYGWEAACAYRDAIKSVRG